MSHRRHTLAWAVVLLAFAARMGLWVAFEPRLSRDTELYRMYASELLTARRAHPAEGFYAYHERVWRERDARLQARGEPALGAWRQVVEYPPPALAVVLVPELLRGETDDRAAALAAYRAGYRTLMAGFDLLTLAALIALFGRVFPAAGSGARLAAGLTYLALVASQYHVAYDRLDLPQAALVMLGLVALTGRRAPWLGLVLLGLAGTFKIVPLLLAPLWALLCLPGRALTTVERRWAWPLVWRGLLVAAVGLLPWLPAYLVAGPRALAFLGYHAERGIEIGSLWGSLMLALGLVGLRPTVGMSHASFTVDGPLAATFSALATPLALVGVLASLALTARAARRVARERPDVPLARAAPGLAVSGTLLTLLVASCASKVLSPQYLLWLFPLAPLLPWPARRRSGWLALLASASLLTLALIPYQLRPLLDQDAAAVAQLALRNLMLLALTGWLAARLWRAGAPQTAPAPAPAPVAAPEPVEAGRGLPVSVLAMLGWVALIGLLTASSKALWLDEAYSLLRSSAPLDRHVRMSEGNPTGYFVAIAGWRTLAPSSPLALRLPSLLAALGALLLLFGVARRWFGDRVATLATALFAASSFAAYFASEVRAYMPALALGLASSALALVLLMGPPRRRRWTACLLAAHLVLSAASVWLLYYLWFNLAAQSILAGLLWLTSPEADRRCSRRRMWALALSMVTALVLFVPEIVLLREKAAVFKQIMGAKKLQTGVPDLAPAARAQETLNRFAAPMVGLHWTPLGSWPLVWTLIAVSLLGVATFAAGLRSGWRPARGPTLAVFCLAVLPWLMVLLVPFKPHRFEAKHLLFTLPWLCTGIGLLARRRPRLAWSLAAPVLLVNLISTATGLVLEKEHWREARQVLADQGRPGDLVLVLPAYVRIPLVMARPEPAPRLDLRPLVTVDGRQPSVFALAGPDDPRRYAALDGAAVTRMSVERRQPLVAAHVRALLAAARRRGQRVWLLETWSNVAEPRSVDVGALLESAGYPRTASDGVQLDGYAGSNPTRIRILRLDPRR